MELHERPWLPEVLGWIPIALTLGVLLLVLYRITFVGGAGLQRAAAASSTPSTPAATGTTAPANQGAAPTAVPTAASAVARVAQPAASPTSAPAPIAAVSPTPEVARPAAAPTPVSKVLTAVVPPSPTAGSSPEPEWTGSYVVERGDTLSAIAARYKVSVQALQERNHIEQANRIVVGQKLVVPAKP